MISGIVRVADERRDRVPELDRLLDELAANLAACTEDDDVHLERRSTTGVPKVTCRWAQGRAAARAHSGPGHRRLISGSGRP